MYADYMEWGRVWVFLLRKQRMREGGGEHEEEALMERGSRRTAATALMLRVWTKLTDAHEAARHSTCRP